jgi:hypothetical protein
MEKVKRPSPQRPWVHLPVGLVADEMATVFDSVDVLRRLQFPPTVYYKSSNCLLSYVSTWFNIFSYIQR